MTAEWQVPSVTAQQPTHMDPLSATVTKHHISRPAAVITPDYQKSLQVVASKCQACGHKPMLLFSTSLSYVDPKLFLFLSSFSCSHSRFDDLLAGSDYLTTFCSVAVDTMLNDKPS